MRRPEDDVWLSNGESYMVEEHRYQQHIDEELGKREKHVVCVYIPSNISVP